MPNSNPEFVKLLSSIMSGHFTGDTIRAESTGTEEIIELFAAISVKPGLAEKIKFLYLYGDYIAQTGPITFVPRLKGFTSLKSIIITGNQLRTVPDGWLDDCASLEEINLKSNNITILPGKLFKNCKELKTIDLSVNALETMPEDLFDGCSALTTLDVSNNKIKILPDALFYSCSSLQKLDLGGNKIEVLPEQLLKNCVSLQDFEVDHNKLKVLPEQLLRYCGELIHVRVTYNNLTEIPFNFVIYCKKIKSFRHGDTPVATKPPPPPPKTKAEIETPIVEHRASRPYHRDPLYYISNINVKTRTELNAKSALKYAEQARYLNSKRTEQDVTLTAAEHAELLKQKAKTDELEKTVAAQSAALADIQQQLRELHKVPLAVEVKQEFTPEEKVIFVKTDVLEAKLADKLHDSRITTVNVLLEQANVLIPQHIEQNQALIKKIEELIWSAHKSEERAANAEQIALMAIAELRNFKEQTMQSLEFIRQHMTENETFLYEAIVRINKLGSAFTVLSAEIGKNNQYATICNAMNEGNHHGAATFMIAFVSKFTTETTFATLAASKKFKFDYGNYGLVSDTLVAIANMVPVTGVGALATMVQMAVKKFEDRKKIASANRIVNTSGKIVGGAEELATRIAVSILQLNGHVIAKCPPEVAGEIAKLCFDAAIKYITTTPKDQTEISAEEIAYAIMNGKFLDKKSFYGGYVLSFDSAGCLLTTRANPDNPTKAREWLSDTLMQYGKNPERFDDIPLPAPHTSTFVRSRSIVTPAFEAFKADMQKKPEPMARVSPENKKRFEVS
jgi:Leucine-rich repeat (LRR) protein